MFEPVTQSLHEISMFAILGFVLAGFYEPLRIGRLFIRTNAVWVGIQDFLFLAASGVVVFAYSLEFGSGYFRYYYLIGLAFGGVVYFLTVGKLINMITRAFADAIRAVVRHAASVVCRRVLIPTRDMIVKVAQKSSRKLAEIREIAEIRRKDLQKAIELEYNNRRRAAASSGKPLDNSQHIGENRNENQKSARPVIRARTTKV